MIGRQQTTDGSAIPAMAMTCPTCGAENTDEARFCRICGVQLGSEGFHEAPTRNFEQRQESSSQPPSQPEVSPFATYGADGSAILPPRDPRMYVPPSVVQQPGTMMGYQHGTSPAGPIPTNPLQTGPVKKSYIGRIFLAVAGVIIFVLVGLIGLGIWVASHVTPTVKDDGKGGVEVQFPGGGPNVSVGENASPESLKGPIADWYYEGSKIETSVNSSVGGVSGAVLEMTTEDDMDTVAEFYRDKFAEIKTKTEVRESDSISFSGGNTHVDIESSGNPDAPTTITVVMGNVGGMPGGGPGAIPQIPPVTVGPPPDPPAPPADPSDGKSKPDAKTAPKAEAAPPAKPVKP